MEVDCLFIPSLTLTQACKLFRITKNKLNLESQLIELQNLLRAKGMRRFKVGCQTTQVYRSTPVLTLFTQVNR